MNVYVAQIGAREIVFSAADDHAALARLAASDDLFETGELGRTNRPDLIELVRESPETVFERPLWAWRPLFRPVERIPVEA